VFSFFYRVEKFLPGGIEKLHYFDGKSWTNFRIPSQEFYAFDASAADSPLRVAANGSVETYAGKRLNPFRKKTNLAKHT
jgi:hypothetical protein